MAQQPNSSIVVFILILVLFVPVSADLQNQSAPAVPYTITLFIPSHDMIHSAQITDMVSSPDKSVIISTSFGLSAYNGTWSTRHLDLGNISEGLMSDYITTIEFDADGNLWIGCPEGIQIYNGVYYRVIRDQQLLKDPNIRDLQRWDNDMWVATGNAGIQRYRNGTWTWFQPFSRDGPGFYEVSSMRLDPATGARPAALVIATNNDGLWIVRSHEDPVLFEEIANKSSTYGLLNQVRQDPRGGVFFFNYSEVVHYSRDQGFVPVLSRTDLTISGTPVNDVAAANDGKLYLATDDGIYVWEDGGIYRHLSRFEGIGTSSIVKTVNIDADNRVWFSTQGYVGYYMDQSSPQSTLIIENATPDVSSVPATSQLTEEVPTLREATISPTTNGPSAAEGTGVGISALIDPVLRAIRTVLSGLGIH